MPSLARYLRKPATNLSALVSADYHFTTVLRNRNKPVESLRGKDSTGLSIYPSVRAESLKVLQIPGFYFVCHRTSSLKALFSGTFYNLSHPFSKFEKEKFIMSKYDGTQIEKNLEAAFAGESRLRTSTPTSPPSPKRKALCRSMRCS